MGEDDDEEFFDAKQTLRNVKRPLNSELFENFEEERQGAIPEELKDGEEPAFREILPYLKDPKIKFSLWTILKDSFGKELTRITFPVYLSSPVNPLQQFAC